MERRDVRKSRWFEDVADYFDLDSSLLQRAVPAARMEEEDQPRDVREARELLKRRFMRPESITLLERVRTSPVAQVSDLERSASWKEYIFLCINAEQNAFDRMSFYEGILRCIVRPLVDYKPLPVVVDYGCGSSLVTRMIAQDYGERVMTISVDVAKYAVEFSVARNRLYNPQARGIVLEDVLAPVDLRDVDLILAYSVFEHLPNSTRQIQGLIDALSPDGLLVENYAGHSRAAPHKSDTWDAYRHRDVNLDLIRDQMVLLHGTLPRRREGAYEADNRERYWIRMGAAAALREAVRSKLRREFSLPRRLLRKAGRFVPGR